jgi:hypothetical protein
MDRIKRRRLKRRTNSKMRMNEEKEERQAGMEFTKEGRGELQRGHGSKRGTDGPP